MFIDLSRITDYNAERFHGSGFSDLISSCRQAEGVDYQMTSNLKYQGFRILFRDFRKYHLDTGSERAKEFKMFKASGGKRLFNHTVFLALKEYLADRDPTFRNWRNWPLVFQDPSTKEVLRFTRRKRSLIDFYNYILWQSEIQLAGCGERCLARHLGIGLSLDIAAGADPDGAETWAQQSLSPRRRPSAPSGRTISRRSRLGPDTADPETADTIPL